MDMLQVKDLKKSYGTGETRVEALRQADFSVAKGEFVSISGPSGSGKSTLLNLLGALDAPTAGTILLDGRNIFSMREIERTLFRRRQIGFIFQAFHLVPELDIEENILLPLLLDGKKPDMALLSELMEMLGLMERKRHRPNQLSGGQQQRVAIARALVTRPALILADEPTGNLDTKSGNDVMHLLRTAVDHFGQTLVMITHNPLIASAADRILRVEDGWVTEQDAGGIAI